MVPFFLPLDELLVVINTFLQMRIVAFGRHHLKDLFRLVLTLFRELLRVHNIFEEMRVGLELTLSFLRH